MQQISTISDDMLPRRGHSLTATDTTADRDLTMVTLFGGSSKPPGSSLSDLQKLAHTTVMIFGECIEVSVINLMRNCDSESSEAVLINVGNNNLL
jgi:hypothetical protein